MRKCLVCMRVAFTLEEVPGWHSDSAWVPGPVMTVRMAEGEQLLSTWPGVPSLQGGQVLKFLLDPGISLLGTYEQGFPETTSNFLWST